MLMTPEEAETIIREAYAGGSLAFHIECADWDRLSDGSGGIWCTIHQWWVVAPVVRTPRVEELEASISVDD